MAEQNPQPIARVEIFDDTFSSLEKAMWVSTQKQAVIAHNIANANTPGYKALTFDEELRQAVTRADQPTVMMEREMSELSQNSIRYSSYVKLMTSKLAILKSVVSQGRK